MSNTAPTSIAKDKQQRHRDNEPSNRTQYEKSEEYREGLIKKVNKLDIQDPEDRTSKDEHRPRRKHHHHSNDQGVRRRQATHDHATHHKRKPSSQPPSNSSPAGGLRGAIKEVITTIKDTYNAGVDAAIAQQEEKARQARHEARAAERANRPRPDASENIHRRRVDLPPKPVESPLLTFQAQRKKVNTDKPLPNTREYHEQAQQYERDAREVLPPTPLNTTPPQRKVWAVCAICKGQNAAHYKEVSGKALCHRCYSLGFHRTSTTDPAANSGLGINTSKSSTSPENRSETLNNNNNKEEDRMTRWPVAADLYHTHETPPAVPRKPTPTTNQSSRGRVSTLQTVSEDSTVGHVNNNLASRRNAPAAPAGLRVQIPQSTRPPPVTKEEEYQPAYWRSKALKVPAVAGGVSHGNGAQASGSRSTAISLWEDDLPDLRDSQVPEVPAVPRIPSIPSIPRLATLPPLDMIGLPRDQGRQESKVSEYRVGDDSARHASEYRKVLYSPSIYSVRGDSPTIRGELGFKAVPESQW